MIDFDQIFSIQKILGHDFAVVKYGNLLEFFKFLPPDLILKFEEYQKFICPSDVETPAFIDWVKRALGEITTSQKTISSSLSIGEAKLSKYVNGEPGLLTLAQKISLADELKRQLLIENIAKKILEA